MLTFSKCAIKISVGIITFLKKILYKIFKIILYPIKCVISIIDKIANILTKNVSKSLNNAKKVCEKCQKSKKEVKNQRKIKE